MVRNQRGGRNMLQKMDYQYINQSLDKAPIYIDYAREIIKALKNNWLLTYDQSVYLETAIRLNHQIQIKYKQLLLATIREHQQSIEEGVEVKNG